MFYFFTFKSTRIRPRDVSTSAHILDSKWAPHLGPGKIFLSYSRRRVSAKLTKINRKYYSKPTQNHFGRLDRSIKINNMPPSFQKFLSGEISHADKFQLTQIMATKSPCFSAGYLSQKLACNFSHANPPPPLPHCISRNKIKICFVSPD